MAAPLTSKLDNFGLTVNYDSDHVGGGEPRACLRRNIW